MDDWYFGEQMIYHILSNRSWDEAKAAGEYCGDTLATEGFIHTSLAQQVTKTANRRFLGRTDLLLLAIDPELLRAELKYEDGGEGEEFPHIYGPLNLDAVVETYRFQPLTDGTFELPPEID